MINTIKKLSSIVLNRNTFIISSQQGLRGVESELTPAPKQKRLLFRFVERQS
jgi:hypothetical protein